MHYSNAISNIKNSMVVFALSILDWKSLVKKNPFGPKNRWYLAYF